MSVHWVRLEMSFSVTSQKSPTYSHIFNCIIITSWTPSLSAKVFLARCSFNLQNKWKSFNARSGLCSGCVRTSHLKGYKSFYVPWTVCGQELSCSRQTSCVSMHYHLFWIAWCRFLLKFEFFIYSVVPLHWLLLILQLCCEFHHTSHSSQENHLIVLHNIWDMPVSWPLDIQSAFYAPNRCTVNEKRALDASRHEVSKALQTQFWIIL